ncbi:hypothetical protein DFH27DRAFT_576577 [Peziza echinospora]|nr:hypothetical protein DFH27DRAFT_576577 [Peziza echinospora]
MIIDSPSCSHLSITDIDGGALYYTRFFSFLFLLYTTHLFMCKCGPPQICVYCVSGCYFFLYIFPYFFFAFTVLCRDYLIFLSNYTI